MTKTIPQALKFPKLCSRMVHSWKKYKFNANNLPWQHRLTSHCSLHLLPPRLQQQPHHLLPSLLVHAIAEHAGQHEGSHALPLLHLYVQHQPVTFLQETPHLSLVVQLLPASTEKAKSREEVRWELEHIRQDSASWAETPSLRNHTSSAWKCKHLSALIHFWLWKM